MPNVSVTMPAALYDRVLTVLRLVREKHTEEVEGTMHPFERCTVCNSSFSSHSMDRRYHICWMSDVDSLLEDLSS